VGADRSFDDILRLDADAETVDAAAPHLAGGGVLAIARPDPMSRPIAMDLGRLHYDNIVYMGTTGSDLDAAYQGTPVRAALQAGGLAWIAGAGGAMGRMHVQRALESGQIICSSLSAAWPNAAASCWPSSTRKQRPEISRRRWLWPRYRAVSTMCRYWPPTRM
jgi:hypothetical protein